MGKDLKKYAGSHFPRAAPEKPHIVPAQIPPIASEQNRFSSIHWPRICTLVATECKDAELDIPMFPRGRTSKFRNPCATTGFHHDSLVDTHKLGRRCKTISGCLHLCLYRSLYLCTIPIPNSKDCHQGTRIPSALQNPAIDIELAPSRRQITHPASRSIHKPENIISSHYSDSERR